MIKIMLKTIIVIKNKTTITLYIAINKNDNLVWHIYMTIQVLKVALLKFG